MDFNHFTLNNPNIAIITNLVLLYFFGIWIHVTMETRSRLPLLRSVLLACHRTMGKVKGCQRSTPAVKRLVRDIRVCLVELWCRHLAGHKRHVRLCQRLLAGVEACIGEVPQGDSGVPPDADADADPVEQALAQVLAQLISAYTGFSQPAAHPHGLLSYEHRVALTALKWLLELRPGELNAQQLCQGIVIHLSEGARSLADFRTITEAELLRLCGTIVRRRSDGAGIELACLNPNPRHHCSGPLYGTPETRYEIAVACLRILNFPEFADAPAEYRLEQVRVGKRDAAHPFYRYAAQAWMDVAPAEGDDATLVQELTRESRRLFSSPRNLTQWLLEVGRQSFVEAYPLPPALIYVSLTNLLAKLPPPPEDIAACLGLAHVCIALLGDDSGDDESSGTVARLVDCALAGPSLLVAKVLRQSWEVAKKNFRLGPCLDTAERLSMARVEDGPPRWINPSSVCDALMAYAARSGPEDVEAFIRLFAPELWAEPVFLDLIRDPAFPYAVADNGRAPTRQQEQFLNALCNRMLDKSWDGEVLREALLVIWDKAVEYNLECARPTTRRTVPMPDNEFSEWMLLVVRDQNMPGIRYLIQDSRWNSNLPLEGLMGQEEEDRGRTLLHYAVEDGATEVVRFLLENGADVSVADACGRTPVHLCTEAEILQLLRDSGADLRQTDNDGRLLWHFAAANNDILLLRMLLTVEPDKDWVWRQTTKKGRTPLAEAFYYVEELTGLPPVSAERYPQFLWQEKRSIRLILESMKLPKLDPAYLCSDIPLVCLAAVWGSAFLVTWLRAFGQLEVVMPDGSGPLHFLNFLSSAELVRELLAVPGVAELPVLNKLGFSPAETIFLAFRPSLEERNDNAHPSNNAKLDRSAYTELLTEKVCASRDEQGRTLWERFCRNVIVRYACNQDWHEVGDAMVTAVSALAEKGAIELYESEADVCAFEVLAKMLWDETSLNYVPGWLLDVYLQLLRVTTKAQRLRDAPQLFVRSSESAEDQYEILFDRLVARLVDMGVDSGRIVRSGSLVYGTV